MGDRGQVLILPEKVYLYTHWGAENLPKTVKAALAKGERWDDPEYLARIIFDEMTKGSPEGETTGYGIGSAKHGDVWRVVVVDCEKQTVTIEDDGKTPKAVPFKKFAGVNGKGLNGVQPPL